MFQSSGPILVAGAQVLDIDGDLDKPAQIALFIEDGLIVETGEAASRAGAARGVEKIDATGKLVIPGLVNAHYHSHDTLLRGMFEQLPLDAWMLFSAPGHFPRLSPHSIELRTALGASECLLNGVTTVQDMVSIVGDDREHLESIVRAYEDTGIRAMLALQISDRSSSDCVAFWDGLPEATAKVLPGAVDPAPLMKLVEDALADRSRNSIHWGLGPSAPQRCSDELLSWVARLSEKHGLQVFTHVYEARSQAVLARLRYPNGSLVEHMDRLGLLTSRLTIAHGVWMSDEEVRRFGRAGANIVCNPVSNLKLLNGFAPIVQYARAGANIGLGCDNCSGNDAQNMFEAMKMFALLWGAYSSAGEKGAAREAFRAATIGAAKVLGMDDRIGVLRPGYQADLAIINLDRPNYRPLNSAIRQLVYSESGRGVDSVMVNGRFVVEDGRLVTVCERKLKRESEKLKEQIADDVARLRARNEVILPDLLEAYEQANQYPLNFDRLLLRRQ